MKNTLKKFRILIFLMFGFGFFYGVPLAFAYPCNNNNICEWPETGNTCSDCHSYDVGSYSNRRAKYIDQNCQYNGNGLSDSCASSSGGVGRFNELQSAISSLVAGDTLYIYPSNYFRAKQQYEYGNYNIYLGNSGTSDRPVIITAYDRNNPPTLYSLNPAGGSTVSYPAITTHWDDNVGYVIIDGIKINGLVRFSNGHNNVMQNIDCTKGGGACDGNWACLRIENCTDCVAHHNFVHDVDDAGFCTPDTFGSRPTGLKEFSATRAIWEYNTIRNAVRWGYDLHRNSVDTIFRYNKIENVPSAIHLDRAKNNRIYGNIALVSGQGSCIDSTMLNEQSPGSHTDEIYNNTCFFQSWGITTDSVFSSVIRNNIISTAMQGGSGIRNINAPGTQHTINNNAYDSNANYHTEPWVDASRYTSLSAWQTATGHDANSIETAGGSCIFINPPINPTDQDYDLHVTEACLTMSSTGGQVGAYGITDCVGYLCSPRSSTPPPPPPPPPTPKVGDLDNDNDVDINDYNILVGNFGRTGSGILGDINSSGAVNIFDYNLLVGNFGR